MSVTLVTKPPKDIVYPETDGKPIAENTLQFRWIVTIEGGLDAAYADDPNVFVAGDLFWYPVQGQPTIVQAPDIMVVFGRPKGERRSYMQWLEGGIAPQAVFEILSPGNRVNEMTRKFQFYERHGVQEYYIYDPDNAELFGWMRSGNQLQEIPSMQGWQSPLLKIRFELVDEELRVIGPDGRPFATYLELVEQRKNAEQEQGRLRYEKEQAERDARQHAETAERLRAQLKALGAQPEV